MPDTQNALLRIDGLTKTYPGVVANDAVTLEVAPGEIHALLGENGAGKSTLVKALYGLVRPDSGTISVRGKAVEIGSPAQARALGIGMVFQHFSLFDAMSVSENIALGLKGAAPSRALNEKIRAVSDHYGLSLEPDALVGDLSVGEKQRVEIIRTLLQEPEILVLDEPTSVLTPQEVEDLFRTLRLLASEGKSVVYISHKLAEIRVLCDRATILRGGKVVDVCTPANETPSSLAEKMIGRRTAQVARGTGEHGDVVLELDLTDAAGLKHAAFRLRAGEIMGIAGVAGNGQGRLQSVLTGEARVRPDQIKLKGEAIGRISPQKRRKAGARFIPEERNGHGAVPEMSLSENIYLTRHQDAGHQTGGMIQTGRLRKTAKAVAEAFKVKQSGVDRPISALSGGNMQKFIAGREVATTPELLVASQPTWGVDSGAAAIIHKSLIDLADSGKAVLIISQDLDELLALCDKIAVICDGALSDTKPTADWTIADLGLAMAGASAEAPQSGEAA